MAKFNKNLSYLRWLEKDLNLYPILELYFQVKNITIRFLQPKVNKSVHFFYKSHEIGLYLELKIINTTYFLIFGYN
ncbi:hypothetical protein BBH99_08520 [Chryseobacterium contaminans]|uniref:Uncharacterized protein n=1 Tax=Chryseobacterium contaminans TaxID=1423959 RepID=A0ABX2X6M1_9FLAO|nr:hypothetical protein BBH99_08520 [Chryseobacterium contaminans]